jgi:hypothetical protein
MNSLHAQVIRGSRVQEHVEDDVRALLGLELCFDDGSWLTLRCAGDGLSLTVEPQPMRWIDVPEHGHIEVHGRHQLCQVLRPGAMLTREHPLLDAGQHTVGVALATQHDDIYVFACCGDLHFARELPPEISPTPGIRPRA